MGIINQLDAQTANLIAAGEVVDRPASACKELLENSIDAGATVITIEIKHGGISLIRISDNGRGMAREDVPICILRHATSKLHSASDLNRIRTLGFRGEALAAISSVAHLRILTKRREDDVGTQLECGPGEKPSISEVAISDGTTIIVENLFENVPARRKFLKRDQTEAMAVQAALERVALSYPAISIRLIIDNQMKFSTSGDNLLKSAIYSIYGRDFSNRLIPIDSTLDQIRVYGFIGMPDNIRGNRNHQIFFVNKRNIRSKCASAALEQAYVSYSSSDKFPVGIVFIDMPTELVDVNIHPTKLEVKFANEKQIFEAVYYAARGALMSSISLPELKMGKNDLEKIVFNRKKRQYEVLNAFTPISDGETPAEKRPYLNQKNVKEGQISFVDPPKNFDEIARSSSNATENSANCPKSAVSDEAQIDADDKSKSIEDFSEEDFNREYEAAVLAELGLTPDELKTVDISELEPLSEDELLLPPEIEELQGHSPNSRRRFLKHSSKSENISVLPDSVLDDPDPLQDFGDVLKLSSDAENIAENGNEFSSDINNNQEEVQAQCGDKAHNPDAFDSEQKDEALQKTNTLSDRSESFRLIGEAFYSYLFVEYGSSIYIIDKHAAHERILFEELKQNYYSKQVITQFMMLPLSIRLTPGEFQAIKDHADEVHSLGFEFDFEEPMTLSLRAIPQYADTETARSIIDTIAEQLASGTGSTEISDQLIFEKTLYQAACKAAIKAGQISDEESLNWIIKHIFELNDIRFCPHGRPVAFEITKANLEHQFKRT